MSTAVRQILMAVLLGSALSGCGDPEPTQQPVAPTMDAGQDDAIEDTAETEDMGQPDTPDPEPSPFPRFEDLPESEALPDLLQMLDGTPVETAEQWHAARRPEILGMLEHYAFGAAPEPPNEAPAVEVMAVYDDLYGGKATLKLLTVRTGPDRALAVDVVLVTPNATTEPVPVFLGANFFGNHTTTDDPRVPLAQGWIPPRGEGVEDNRATEASRGTVASRWPFEAVIDRGYGLATFYHGDFDPDMGDFDDGIHGLYPGERGDHDWGTIAAWSWGVSRLVDVLVSEPGVDGERIAVVGHSRNGKVALWSAARDERIAMAVANMSGCMGAALSRRRQGETISAINLLFPHWFAGALAQFNRREEKLPFDQHFLVALSAPRPVLVVSGVEDSWADPEGEFLGAKEADPVYRLLGAGGMNAEAWPAQETLVDGVLGYYMSPGDHAITPESWTVFMDFADLHLKP